VGKTYTYTLKAYADKNESNEVSTEIITKSRPTINTSIVKAITENTASSGGIIVSDGGSPITAKGLVWSTSVDPTVDLTTKTNVGIGFGSFEQLIQNLTANTRYYVKAYATNIIGTAYGNQISFTTSKQTTNPIIESLNYGLVAYYPFNGNANDESGNGNDGTVIGASLVPDRFNNLNKAYFLNGINNYIRMQKPGPIGNPTVSISFWLNSVNQKSEAIISWGDNGKTGNDFRVYQNGRCSGSIAFDTFDSAINYQLGDFTNSWNHFVVIYDGAVAPNVFSSKVYVNGISAATTCFTQNLGVTNILGSNPITIGRYHGTVQEGFLNASIDDIRIYNRVLTQEEINYLANN
jgi:hypothetical protein